MWWLGSEFLWVMAAVLVCAIVVPYVSSFRGRLRRDRDRRREAVRLGIDRPVAQYPFVDAARCIGCGTCVKACPEGDVLGVVGGTATVINGLRCVGHGLCEIACPVGAIQVGLGDLRAREDVPLLDETLESTLPGVYVAGELGGLALVRNAACQGRKAMEHIAEVARRSGEVRTTGTLDVVIVGAGPAGLSAALTARERGLRYLVVERESTLGGSLLHYPRRKMVLTHTVELRPWGCLDREEYSKETLLEVFERIVSDEGLRIRFGEPVEAIQREAGGYRVLTAAGAYPTRRVLLAMGRRGTPRKLGVPGEDLSKVMYRLLDAEGYRGERILIVGGGDSAAEAAVGLARGGRNEVFLSYRRERLVRIKRKNEEALERLFERGHVRPVFSSNVAEIRPESVLLKMDPSQGDPGRLELPNDYVFIFAGGVPPFGFLKKMGIRFGGPEASATAA